MQSQPSPLADTSTVSNRQVAHIIVAGLQSSDKHKLIRQISETPLETVNIARDTIPTRLPDLTLGKLRVDSRLTAHIWGAPDKWQHDYVNYLVNIKSILAKQGDYHRVMGMIVVIDSLMTVNSAEEAKLLRLIDDDWNMPYIILASHPYHPHARTLMQLRDVYQINDNIPLYACDVNNHEEAHRAFINLLYQIL